MKPEQLELLHVDDGGPFPHAADHPRSIDAAQQAIEIRIAPRIVEHDRILDGDRHSIGHQPADRIESGLLVGAETVFGLEVEDQGQPDGLRDFAKPGFHAARIAWIAAGQRHDCTECVPPQQARLIHGPPERWTDTRDCPARGRERRQPPEERVVLVERDVVEEGVPAVEDIG